MSFDLSAIFSEHWNKAARAISEEEARFIGELIRIERPRSFCEVGTASGLSGGVICNYLSENGGIRFTTVDVTTQFIGDRSRETGYLIPELYSGSDVSVTRVRGKKSLDLSAILDGPIDMGFIDANHQHPWPIIDTLCMLPHMSPDGIIIHHDLALYKEQEEPRGIGPKYLWDQLPEDCRLRNDTGGPNIFALKLKLPKADIARCFADALLLPWTLQSRPGLGDIVRFRDFVSQHYPKELLRAFDNGFRRYY